MSVARFLSICFCLFMGFSSLSAQHYDQAIGLRGGTSFQLSYKEFFSYYPSPQMAWEVLVGVHIDERRRSFTNGYVVEGMWYYHRDIGFNTNFSAYGAAGLHMGVYTPVGEKRRFGAGLAIALGAEYTFNFTPVNIALDWKPVLGSPRSSLLRGALTIRYILPTTWQ
ncbi:hypothetical protein SapgrDRAFT_1095 [Saprospira grandis DSM 2844]|uniref:Secreted protein n=1 Tax=Saprospira grandis DSM 2844 TaxID=694433 RepID=J1I2A0_9BACT|nr:hypothetical protein [Saprospira grandis]EJF52820.1 hypothetical protein SapgrDRAFT_1095 [Saprospira grandis DSM 2844]